MMSYETFIASFANRLQEHSDRIYVRTTKDGKVGSYALTDLPAEEALFHVARLLKELRLPVYMLPEGASKDGGPVG